MLGWLFATVLLYVVYRVARDFWRIRTWKKEHPDWKEYGR